MEFRPDPNWVLQRYELVFPEADGTSFKKQGTFFEGRYCKVIVAGYTGTVRQLFDAAADPRIINNLIGFHPPKSVLMGIADLAHPTPKGVGEWNMIRGRLMYVGGVSMPAGSGATGAWILFPLTKVRADEVIKELNAKYGAGELTSVTTAESLRRDGKLAGCKTSTETGDVKLVASDDPRWYEVLSNGSAPADAVPLFTHNFELVNPEEWIKDARVADAWQVVVYVAKVKKAGSDEIVEVVKECKLEGEPKALFWHVQPASRWAAKGSPLVKEKDKAPVKPVEDKAPPKPVEESDK